MDDNSSEKPESFSRVTEHWTEALNLLIPYNTAFDLCQESIQKVPYLKITYSDRDSGLIHAADRPEIRDIIFTVKRTSHGTTGIILQAVTRNPSLTVVSEQPSDSLLGNERLVKTLTRFLKEQGKTDKRYERELTIPVPYTTAFDLCRRSVQTVSDLAVLEADPESGIIHAGQPDIRDSHLARIIFTIDGITSKKSHITITDTNPDFENYNYRTRQFFRRRNERNFSTISNFITKLGKNLEFQSLPDTEIQEAPIRITMQENAIKTNNPGPDLNHYSPYLFILAGIILIFLGVFIDISIIVGFFQGTWIMPDLNTVHVFSHGPEPAILTDFLGSLITPGIFALAFGYYMLMKSATSHDADTDLTSPTGICVGKGQFYCDPFKAGIYSAIIPGLGQAYNGRADKGLLVAFLTGSGLLFGLIPGILVWIYAIRDANSTAHQINREEIPFSPLQQGIALIIVAIFIPCFILTLFLFFLYGPAVALGLNFTTMRGP